MGTLLANPFFIYILSFLTTLLVYSLGWSMLYPRLKLVFLSFFALTFVIAFLGGFFLHVCKKIEYRKTSWKPSTITTISLIWAGYIAEFIYNKGIPLILILKGSNYEYSSFGIPSFHVFLVTFNSFFSVYVFHQLISDFRKTRFVYFLMTLFPAILIVNRGMSLIILTACLFLFVLARGKFKLKTYLSLLILVFILFYLFGLIGNLRQTHGTSISSETILKTSRATERFKNSLIPDQYIWSYIYISSPLANFQNAVNRADASNRELIAFVNYEILPDFLSKRTSFLFDSQPKSPPLIAPWLTVGTFYTQSYIYMGWIGVVLMFLYFFTSSILYPFLLRKDSHYYITGIALLNTLVVYNTFDNMYSFSGMSLQLAYPIVFGFVSRLKLKKINVGLFMK